MADLQKLLDKYNPDFDPNSEASKKRRAEFQSDPATMILQFLAAHKPRQPAAAPLPVPTPMPSIDEMLRLLTGPK